MENAIEKKFLSYHPGYTLYTNGGNVKSKWFVAVKVNRGGVMLRKKLYNNINRPNTIIGKYREAIRAIRKFESEPLAVKQCNTTMLQQMEIIMQGKAAYLRDKTVLGYMIHCRHFEAWCMVHGIKDLNAVTRSHVVAYRDSLDAANVTKNTYLRSLHSLYNSGVTAGIVKNNPVMGIKRLPEFKEGKLPLSKAMRANLLKAVKYDKQLYMGCLLQFFCAVRPGREMTGLRVYDFNIDDNSITMRAAISKNKKTQVITIPKQFQPIVARWIKGLKPNDYFISRGPVLLGRDTLSKRYTYVTAHLGYPSRYTFYSWKHSGIYENARNKTMSLKELQLHDRHHSLDQMNEYLRSMGIVDAPNIKDNYADV